MSYDFAAEHGTNGIDAIRLLTAEIWADLAFDEAARAALKRDGFALDGVRLTGPNPFVLTAIDENIVRVETATGTDGEAYLDLWRLHFLRRVSGPGPHRDAA